MHSIDRDIMSNTEKKSMEDRYKNVLQILEWVQTEMHAMLASELSDGEWLTVYEQWYWKKVRLYQGRIQVSQFTDYGIDEWYPHTTDELQELCIKVLEIKKGN